MVVNTSSNRAKRHATVPFWNRMPSFFLYPFTPSILLRTLLFSAIAIFGFYLNGLGIVFFLTVALAWIFILRHASRVLVETSMGHLTPGKWSLDVPDDLTYMPFKIFAMFAFYGMVIGAVTVWLGELGALLANLFMILVMPAAMIALVIGGSLRGSLNPSFITNIMRSIGRPYLLLCLFLFCLSSSNMFVTSRLGKMAAKPAIEQQARVEQLYRKHNGKMNQEAAEEMMQILEDKKKLQMRTTFLLFLAQTASMHFLIIGFNMMGYIAYQYRGELGLSTEGDGEPEDEDPSQAIARLLAQGKVSEALDIAYEAQRLDQSNPEAMETYNKLLHLAGKNDQLASHTTKLIPLLISKGLTEKALEALHRCREKQADFVPQPTDLLALAQATRKRGNPRQALQLLSGFERKFHSDKIIPDIYFFYGSVLCQDLRQDNLAIRFFNALCTLYPQHERVAEAQRLIVTLNRMSTQKTD